MAIPLFTYKLPKVTQPIALVVGSEASRRGPRGARPGGCRA